MLISIYWRDIPSQVIVKKGRKSSKIQLSERFQVAIDKAAMRAGRQGSSEYLDDWRRDYTECGDDRLHIRYNLCASHPDTPNSLAFPHALLLCRWQPETVRKVEFSNSCALF